MIVWFVLFFSALRSGNLVAVSIFHMRFVESYLGVEELCKLGEF